MQVSILILLDYPFLFCIKSIFILAIDSTGFNPYFIGLPILMSEKPWNFQNGASVSILILLDYPFLYRLENYQMNIKGCFNPYFIGLPILILLWRLATQSLTS